MKTKMKTVNADKALDKALTKSVKKVEKEVKDLKLTRTARALVTPAVIKADPLGMVTGLKAIAAPVQPKVSLKESVLDVFKSSPAKELKTDDVVNAVQSKLPKAKKDNILWQVSLLKKDNQIHRVRMDGHSHVLKFGPGSAPKVTDFRTVMVSSSPKAKTAPKASSGDLGDALVQLSSLVEQREKIDMQITLAKAKITELVTAV